MKRIEQKEHNAIIMYLLSIIATYAICVNLLKIFEDLVPRYISSRLIEIIAFLFLFIFLKFTPFTIKRTGLKASSQDIRRTFIRCGILSLLIIIVLIVSRIILTPYYPPMADRPWFSPQLQWGMRWLYPVTSIVQEFLAKGILQENMKRLLGEEHPYLAILACAIVFAIVHMGYSALYMIAAFVLNLVTGYIYEKDHSIWGCALIHFTIGFFPRALGLITGTY